MGKKNARNKSIESLNAASEESIKKIRAEAERLTVLFELLAIKEGHVKTSEPVEIPLPPPIAPISPSPPRSGIFS